MQNYYTEDKQYNYFYRDTLLEGVIYIPTIFIKKNPTIYI